MNLESNRLIELLEFCQFREVAANATHNTRLLPFIRRLISA